MADYEAEGIVLVDAWEQEERRNWVMDKPVHAKVERTYLIQNGEEAQRVLEDAAGYAESNGWRLQPSSLSPDTAYRGAKTLDPGDARLILSVDALEEPQSEGSMRLRVVLDFGVAFLDGPTSGDEGD